MAQVVRAVAVFSVTAVARVEVPAAMWRKARAGALRRAQAAVLVSEFEAN